MRNCWVFFLAILGCQTEVTPEEVFQAAKEKFYEADEVSFSHEMLWENPYLGEVDTVMRQLVFQKNLNIYYDYNYIAKRATYELSYLDDILISINHKDSTHTFYSEETDWDYENRAGNNSFLDFSLANLLKKDPWIYKQDTAINLKKYLDFFQVDMDTTIDAKKVGEDYGVKGYPTFYLIDENGKIEEVFEGFDDGLIEKIKKGS